MVEKSTGHRDPLLDSVVIPQGGEWIWGTFWEIRKGESIPFSEIEAWERLSGIHLERWERMALISMDRAVSEYIAEVTRNA